MKKILSYLFVLSTALTISSCDKGLEELNVNTTLPTAVDPAFLLNNAIINSSMPVKTLVFDLGVVQQMISPNGGVLAGANFNQDSRDVTTPPIWAVYYQNVIKYTKDAIVKTQDIPARSNLKNMARIFQAYAFMVLTDEYGDIPYTEAGKGYTDLIFLQKYDAQQAIYTDLINELTTATAALDAAGAIETNDMLYSGNIAKWKKFGYSLLLRAGMRLSKADVAKAQATAAAAFAGGL